MGLFDDLLPNQSVNTTPANPFVDLIPNNTPVDLPPESSTPLPDQYKDTILSTEQPPKSTMQSILDFLSSGKSAAQADKLGPEHVQPVVDELSRQLTDTGTSDTFAGQIAPLIETLKQGTDAVHLPEPMSRQQPDAVRGTIAGLANLPTDMWNFVFSPEGLATIGTIEAGGPLWKSLINAGFSSQAINGAIESAKNKDAYGVVQSLGIAALTGKGAAGEAGQAFPKETTQPSWEPGPLHKASEGMSKDEAQKILDTVNKVSAQRAASKNGEDVAEDTIAPSPSMVNEAERVLSQPEVKLSDAELSQLREAVTGQPQSPDVTRALAQSGKARAIDPEITASIVNDLKGRNPFDDLIPKENRESQSPVMETAAEKAMRITSQTPLKSAADLAVENNPVTPAPRVADKTGVPFAQQAAEDYVKTSGIGRIEPPSQSKVDVNRARKIAQDYENLPDVDNSPETQASYDAFAKEVEAQYQHALKQGIKFDFTSGDPYQSSADMMNDLLNNRRLRVFTGGDDHPYIGSKTRDENGLTINDKFRAIHDLYGHATEGNQFGPMGEERAWRKHAAMFSDAARPAMTAETRGQNSWVNYGPHMFDAEGRWLGDKSHPKFIPAQNRPFAKQKASLLPAEHSQIAPSIDEIANHVVESTKKNGGATISLAGEVPNKGFSFAPDKATETKVPAGAFGVQAVKDFMQKHAKALEQPGAHVGAWMDENGVPTLDISVISASKDDALRRAAQSKQQAIYDLERGQEIPVTAAPATGQGADVSRPVETGAVGDERPVRGTSEQGSSEGVSTSNAHTDQIAREIGAPGHEVETRHDTEVAAQVDRILAKDPDAAQRVVEKLSSNPEASTGHEKDIQQALIRRRLAQLETARQAAVEAGDSERLNEVRNDLLQAVQVSRDTGTDLARGLRQRLVTDEERYAPGRMEAEAKVTNGGKDLKPAEQKRLEHLSKRINKAREQLTNLSDEPRTRKQLLSKIDQKADEALKRIRQRLGHTLAGVPDPRILADAATVTAKYVAHGVDKAWGRAAKFLTDAQKNSVKERFVERVTEIFKDFDVDTTVNDALEGKFLKGWYENFSGWMTDLFGSDKPRFAKVFGSFGANTPPLENTVRALKLWTEWVDRGRPTDIESIDRILEDTIITAEGKAKGRTAEDIMAWGNNIRAALTAKDPETTPLSGPKVDPYSDNFLGNLDRATLDRHMGIPYALQRGLPFEESVKKGSTIFGRRTVKTEDGRTIGGQGFPGMAYEAHLREAAQELSKRTGEPWKAAHVQETLWGKYQPMKILAEEMGTTVDKLLSGEEPYDKNRLSELQSKITPDQILENETVKSEINRYKEVSAAERTRRPNEEGSQSEAQSQPGVVERLEAAAERATARKRQRWQRLNAQIFPVNPADLADTAIIGAAKIARGLKNFDVWASEMIDHVGDWIKPHLREVYRQSQAMFEQQASRLIDSRRKQFVNYREQKTKALRGAIQSGKPLDKVRPVPVEMTPAMEKVNNDYNKAKQDYEVFLEQLKNKNRPMSRRVVDTLVDLARALKLSSLNVFGKLGSAGLQRVGQNIGEEVVGAGLSVVPGLRQVMKEAPTEGAPTLKSTIGYIKGLGKGAGKTVQQFPKIFTKEGPDYSLPELSGFEGQKVHVPSRLDIPGRLHAAVKQPFKVAQMEMAVQKAIRSAIVRGEKRTPETMNTAKGQANKAGLRAIYMNDNIVSQAWGSFVNYLENNKTAPRTGYALSRIARVLVPVVRVGPNIAIEWAHMNSLGVPGAVKLAEVAKRGMSTLRPEEADFIARSFKKGAVGAALFALGYYNRNNFGGLYMPGQKDHGPVKHGEASIFGHRVPWWFFHTAAALQMQLGATVGKLVDQHKPTANAFFAIGNELLNETPFADAAVEVDKMFKPGSEGTYARGRFVQGNVIPQVVKNIAEFTDPLEKRYPKSVIDHLKMGIPGLREQVPGTKSKSKRR